MFNQYINEHGSRLFGLTLKLCKNREDAEDLYQETWIKAYRFIEKYDSDKEFGAWITSICINTYRDMLRRQKWRFMIANFKTNEEKDYVLSSIPAAEQEDYSDMRNAVDGLPNKYRIAVILHYYDDLDVKKTADVLKIPEGTVKYHLHKARELLKRSLETDG